MFFARNINATFHESVLKVEGTCNCETNAALVYFDLLQRLKNSTQRSFCRLKLEAVFTKFFQRGELEYR